MQGDGHREPLAQPLSEWRIICWLFLYLHLESLLLLDECKSTFLLRGRVSASRPTWRGAFGVLLPSHAPSSLLSLTSSMKLKSDLKVKGLCLATFGSYFLDLQCNSEELSEEETHQSLQSVRLITFHTRAIVFAGRRIRGM